MRKIVNILYNENYNGIRDIVNNSTHKDVMALHSAIKGDTAFNSTMAYLFLYLINTKCGTCDNICKFLGHKSIFDKNNLYNAYQECVDLYDTHSPSTKIVREQIDDYEKIYGWNLEDKFLFPSNGTLYVIVCLLKLMNSTKHIEKYPSEYDRYKFIIENQIYIVNEKAIDNFYLSLIIDVNNDFDKNIFTGDFFSMKYNEYNKNVYKASFGESVLHVGKKKRSFEYNYHKYINKCITICQITNFLTSSRWFQTQSGDFKDLKRFRRYITSTNSVRLLNYYDIFPDPNHTGGLSYMIIDNNYVGDCFFKKDGLEINLKASSIILKSAYQYQILDKIRKGRCLDSIFFSSGWANIKTNDKRLSNEEDKGMIKVYVSPRKGGHKWIGMECLTKKTPIGYYNWKVLTPETVETGYGLRENGFVIAEPYELCNQTYCGFIVDSKEEAESLVSYLKTDFANKIILYGKIKNHINEHCVEFLPRLPLDRKWTDETITEYLELNSQEKQIIYG